MDEWFNGKKDLLIYNQWILPGGAHFYKSISVRRTIKTIK